MATRQRPSTGERPVDRTLSRPPTRDPDPAPAREKNAARQAVRRRSPEGPVSRPVRRKPAGRLTKRAAVLALVVCALVLSLAYPMKQYLAQRSQIAQLAAQNAAKQAQVDALEHRKAQFKDPAYIKMLARERLQYVIPGESQYVVVKQGETGNGTGGSGKTKSSARSPWYSQLWGSVQKADRAP